MQKNPAIVIIRKITKKQAEYIKSNLEKDSRTTSIKLFNILYALRIKDVDKKKIFKKLFGYDYLEDKDYLLRNELRLLRQKLDDCLINLALEDELKNNHFFRCKQRLFAYKHFGIDELFEEEYENTIKCAEDNLAFEDAISFQRWTMDKAYHHKLNSLITYEERAIFFKKLTEECTESLKKYNASIVRINNCFALISNHYKGLLGKAENNITLNDKETIEIEDHPQSLYYYFRSKGLATSGLERVNYFIKSLEQIKNHPFKNNYLNELALNSIINIGRSLQQSRDFEGALDYLSKGVDEYLPLLTNYPSTEKLYANYIVALLNTYQYDKALIALDSIEDKKHGFNYTNHWFTIYRILCLAALDKQKEFNSSMPVNFNNIPPQHRLYLRLLQGIGFYLFNNIEDANREMYNLHKSIKNKEHGTDIFRVVDIYQSAFKLFAKSTKENLLTKEKIILDHLMLQIEKISILDINTMPFLLWLKREIIENG